jgi:hypothetical protein
MSNLTYCNIPYTPPIVGLKLRSMKNLEATRLNPKKVNWYGVHKAAPNKAFQVICHKPHSSSCKAAFESAFNTFEHFKYRPGMYKIKYIPATGVINTGNSGVGNTLMEEAVSRRLTIESADTKALLTWHVFESDCISHLDTPIKFDTQPLVPFPTYLWSNTGQPQTFPCKLTLRQVLLGIAYPPPNGYPSGHLDAKGGIHIVSPYNQLFLSVDLVQKSYAQRDQNIIKCVALD